MLSVILNRTYYYYVNGSAFMGHPIQLLEVTRTKLVNHARVVVTPNFTFSFHTEMKHHMYL